LLLADAVGLGLAYILVDAFSAPVDGVHQSAEWSFLLTLPIWIVIGVSVGLYDGDRSTRRSIAAVASVATITVGLSYVGSILLLEAKRSLLGGIAFCALAIALVMATRLAVCILLRHTSRQRTVVVGHGVVAQQLAGKLIRGPRSRVEIIGFVDSDRKRLRHDLKELPELGRADELPSLVRSLGVDRVVVGSSNASHEETVRLLDSIKDLGVRIDVVPRPFRTVDAGVALDDFDAIRVISISPSRHTAAPMAAKRAIDVVCATVGLVLLAPLFAFVAWRIKRESPGPVFFKQTRVGKDMKPFTMLKFRSMWEGTDSRSHQGSISEVMRSGSVPADNHLHKLDRADAVTTTGQWIRRWSVDELPQLVNVLRGEMSLVGPRPCIPYELEHFRPHHFERFRMPAGITGLWQATARARATFAESLEMDVLYVNAWSLPLDLRLLARTMLVLTSQQGLTK